MHHATFPVILDANVLIPVSLCDVLLRASRKGLIQVYWSEEILEEMRRNLVVDYRRSEAQAARRVTAMKAAFPEAMVTGYEQRISAMRNHPKDRHVSLTRPHRGCQAPWWLPVKLQGR